MTYDLGVAVILVATRPAATESARSRGRFDRLLEGQLVRMFAAPIELHAGSSTQTGELAFTPSGLRHRAPGAATPVRYQLDATSRRYVAARR